MTPEDLAYVVYAIRNAENAANAAFAAAAGAFMVSGNCCEKHAPEILYGARQIAYAAAAAFRAISAATEAYNNIGVKKP